MPTRDGFGVLILTHGRAEFTRQATVASLSRHGYTGPWWIVLDDEDETAGEYERLFPGRVRYFTKDDTAQDLADNGGSRGVIVYARNAADRIGRELGLQWVMQLDDDYKWFEYRIADETGSLRSHSVNDLDAVCDALVDLLEDTGALTVAMAQGGDHIGGVSSNVQKVRLARKAMNSFVTRVGRPVRFVGRLNEDVNTYIWRGSQGDLFFTPAEISLVQFATQLNEGGMSDAYTGMGTYMKSFYTVMFAPSCTKVAMMGDHYARIHHGIRWDRAVPKIVAGRWRKPR